MMNTGFESIFGHRGNDFLSRKRKVGGKIFFAFVGVTNAIFVSF